MASIQYKRLLDYILGVLYDLKQNGQHGYFSVRDILDALDYQYSSADILDIVKYLEAQGYIRALYHLGGASMEITARGIIHVEEQLPALLTEIKSHIDAAKSKKLQSQSNAKTPNEVKLERAPIYLKLKEIRAAVERQLGDKAYDISKDIDVLQVELEKLNPDLEIVGSKLNTISFIETIRPMYKQLTALLNL